MTLTRIVAAALLIAPLAACGGATAQPIDLDELRSPPQGSRTFGVYEGKTPCGDCERIKVALTLFVDQETNAPTKYLLERIYVGKGDDRTINEGTWQTTTGSPTDAEAVVVQLDTAPPEFHRYQRVGKEILLILDAGDRPLVGDAQHSFTLSQTQ